MEVMADDFAEVKRAYQEFKQKSAHQDRQLKHAQQQRMILKERLNTLSSRRTDLDNQEKKLQQADAQFVDQIKNLQSSQAERLETTIGEGKDFTKSSVGAMDL